VAILTSAGPARALGLKQKGHLGVGADGDITIYSEKPNDEGVLLPSQTHYRVLQFLYPPHRLIQ